jgi:hypothetical protein
MVGAIPFMECILQHKLPWLVVVDERVYGLIIAGAHIIIRLGLL